MSGDGGLVVQADDCETAGGLEWEGVGGRHKPFARIKHAASGRCLTQLADDNKIGQCFVVFVRTGREGWGPIPCHGVILRCTRLGRKDVLSSPGPVVIAVSPSRRVCGRMLCWN